MRWPPLVPFILFALGCRPSDLPLWGPPPAQLATGHGVTHLRDVAYYHGSERDPTCHTLDLYLPQGRRDFPVLVLVHGGAWHVGDNRCWGLASAVGSFLASQGVGVVMPNYRLSPEAQHPAHAHDVARAVAWARACIADHGGDPTRLYLLGHSAGGHLVSLVAADPTYLAAEGLDSTCLKGVVAVSGVYQLPPGKQEVHLGGSSELAFHLGQLLPPRADTSATNLLAYLPPLALHVDVYGSAFGDDPRVRFKASPIAHVRPGLPPFLLLYAENDLPTLPRMAHRFAAALQREGCAVTLREVPARNHNSILFHAIDRDDPVAAAILRFVQP